MTSLAGKSQSWADAADEEDATSSGPKLNKDAELPKELAEKLKLGTKKDAGSDGDGPKSFFKKKDDGKTGEKSSKKSIEPFEMLCHKTWAKLADPS